MYNRNEMLRNHDTVQQIETSIVIAIFVICFMSRLLSLHEGKKIFE